MGESLHINLSKIQESKGIKLKECVSNFHLSHLTIIGIIGKEIQ